MVRRQEHPVAPRVSAPDLPPVLDDVDVSAGLDHEQARLTGLVGDVDLAHGSLEACVLEAGAIDTLSLRGATLVDVDVAELRAVTVAARDASLRRVRIVGGRIGTLDLAGARLAEVELRGARVDYLSLAGARIDDLLIVDSTLRTIDMPQAQLARVAFAGCRADEVDTRDMHATHLDLRGLDALAYLDVLSLRGATLTADQVRMLAPAFATAAGVQVDD